MATEAAYDASASRASSGSAHFSSQSSSGMPSPPIARTCGKCTCVSTKPGSTSPLAQVDDSSEPCTRRRTARAPRSRRRDDAGRGRTPRAGRPPVNGLRGVSRKVPRKTRHRHCSRAPSRSNAASSCGRDRHRDRGRLLAGGHARAARSASRPGRRPRQRARTTSSCERNRAHLADDPISPIGPRWSAAQRGVEDREVLGVVVGQHQHAGAGRQLGEHQLGQHRHVVDVHRRDRVGQRRERAPSVRCVDRESTRCRSRSWRARIRASSRPTWPTPKMRHGRYDGQRLEQHGHLSPAALHAVLERRLVRQVRGERLRRDGAGRDQLARAAYGLLLEVAAADRRPRRRGRDDHLGAGLPRRVAAHVGHRHQHAGLPRRPQRGHGREPRASSAHLRARRARSAPSRRPRASPARRARATEPGGPNAAHASRSASRTLNASISGGSPTALEP